MVATRSDSKMEEVEKEIGEVKQDLNKLKSYVDVIKEYLEELRGWMVKSSDKLDALLLQSKGKQPMIQESPQASALGANAGATSGDGDMENVPVAVNNKETVTVVRDEVKTDSGIRKLELPLFNGEDLYGWVFRVERYFQFNNIDEDGVAAATVYGRIGAELVSLDGGQDSYARLGLLKASYNHQISDHSRGTVYEELLAI